MKEIVYARRDPDADDWKIFPCLYVNTNTDTLFIKASKGWLKIPTEYSVIHNQPERLNPEARKGCDSLNFAEMQRGESEEVFPPGDRS